MGHYHNNNNNKTKMLEGFITVQKKDFEKLKQSALKKLLAEA